MSEVAVESGKVVGSFKTGSGVYAIDLSDDGKTLIAIDIDIVTGDQKSVALNPAPCHLTSIHWYRDNLCLKP